MIDPNRPVRVFKNLKHGCYSIMQAGRVKASAREVRLVDVEFRVREAGRERMLREGRKNVHAFAVGRLVDHVHPDDPRELVDLEGRAVHYNPYATGAFVDSETGTAVSRAAEAQFESGRVVYRAGDERLPRAA